MKPSTNWSREEHILAFKPQCCITGLAIPALLTASHIIPWAKDPANRLNPRNGLCLNALHDRAFDRGLLWIDENFVIRISSQLSRGQMGGLRDAQWLCQFENQPLRLPKNFTPDPTLLSLHAQTAQQTNAA
jgi:putative restriction endonuclease